MLLVAVAVAAAPIANGFMDCGSTPLCGVITLETGFGSGNYKHDQPSVHGLWPETGSYGSSKCVKPSDMSDPTKVYECYAGGGAAAHQLEFETHEWDKHGRCAGVRDVDDFFSQICSLASSPLKVMTQTRSGGSTDLQQYASDLKTAGFPVFDASDEENMQLQLSACASADGRWTLASPAEFSTKCGGSGPSPGPSPGPAPSPVPNSTQCVPNQHGPACSANDDCHRFSGCLRCAHSGFCTAQPL